MKKPLLALMPIVLVALTLSAPSISAGDKPFPKIVPALAGSQPEGFALGRGTSAYNSSPDGSIYKMDLRSGQGNVLVPVQDPEGCIVLGMRVDRRSNNLFAAGCVGGNAFVYNAYDGGLKMDYPLGPPGESIVNDLAITRDAVYFTDSYRPVLYRLPLSKNGKLPDSASGVTEIPLPEEFAIDPEVFCCGANGIVATRDGKTLIIGHSNLSMLYRVDLASGDVDAIAIDPPLDGFLDGIAMKGRTLYIMTPFDPNPVDRIQVVKMDKGLLSGKLVGTITDPDLDGVASGAIRGNALYVNNARYNIFPPQPDTQYWVTKLKLHHKGPHHDHDGKNHNDDD